MSAFLKTIAVLFLITMIPGLELRASIPMGILGCEWINSPMPWYAVVVTCYVSNVIIGWLFFTLLHPMVSFFRCAPFIDRLLAKYLDRAQRKLKPGVQKYGFWGLAMFIGIPLPMTGAYTGAAGAYALGMDKRKFMLANLAGVLMAAVLVTIITLLIQGGYELFFFKYLIKQS